MNTTALWGAAVRSNPELGRKHQGDRTELLALGWLMDRGFEVFRNISSRGPIDLVAMKGAEIYKFDVKKCYRYPKTFPPLTAEQRARGVQILAVYDDGHCEIVMTSKGLSPMSRRRKNIARPVGHADSIQPEGV
jgi:hypothetical protein